MNSCDIDQIISRMNGMQINGQQINGQQINDEAKVERPPDVRPTDVRPTGVRSSDVRPTGVRSSDVRPTNVRSSDGRSKTGVKPAEIEINNRVSEEPLETQTTELNDLSERMNGNGLNYYAILGCGETATDLEIKKAYQKKLKSCHPDKVRQTKETTMRYKLIREAGEILKDSMKRRAYDMERKTICLTKGYEDQVAGFKEYMKLQESHNNDENMKIAQLRFEESQKEFLKRHHMREDYDQPIAEGEYNRRYDDMMMQREMEEVEYIPDDIFRGKQYNNASFNQIFERVQKKNNIDNSHNSKRIIKYEDIQAFNTTLESGTSLDNYDKLYADDVYDGAGDGFGRVGELNETNNELDDILSIESISDDENDKPILSKNDMDEVLRKMIAERNEDIQNFGNRADVGYGSAMDNPLTISNQLGFVIGNNMFGQQTSTKQNMDTAVLKAYKGLLENNDRTTEQA